MHAPGFRRLEGGLLEVAEVDDQIDRLGRDERQAGGAGEARQIRHAGKLADEQGVQPVRLELAPYPVRAPLEEGLRPHLHPPGAF
ncbi:hypothetical protein D3C86_1846490 [compost metagenome]